MFIIIRFWSKFSMVYQIRVFFDLSWMNKYFFYQNLEFGLKEKKRDKMRYFKVLDLYFMSFFSVFVMWKKEVKKVMKS